MQVKAEDLRVGDTIEVWWKSGRDTILEIKPYIGDLADIMCGIATFAVWGIGMSLEKGQTFEVVGRSVLSS